MKEKDQNEFKCQTCGSTSNVLIIDDYSNMHSRETMCHCINCDSIFVLHYKFARKEMLRKGNKDKEID